MTETLNSGKGRCIGTARLLIRPVQAVIELGAAPDVLAGTLNCVHHANRTGHPEDFIAVAFPQMHKGREIMRAGHDIELIGSEVSLQRLADMDGIAKLRRRGMLKDFDIGETWSEPGIIGAAYVRDRSVEKYTAGWLRRSRARAERRGKPVGRQLRAVRKNDRDSLPLRYGNAVVHVREVVSKMTEKTLMISTYGFSSPAAPAILPVVPDSAMEPVDAG